MAVLVTCALAVLLLGGLFPAAPGVAPLPGRPSPAPPPTPEEAALDRWNAGVVMLVAGLSVVGAIIAFWASSQFSSASGLSQQAVQEVTQYQTVKAEQDGYVDFGARLNELYQEHTVAESTLYCQAAAAWAGGTGRWPAPWRRGTRRRRPGARPHPGVRVLLAFQPGTPAGRSCTTRPGCGPARWSRPACSPARTPRRCAPWTPPIPTPSRPAPPPTAPGAQEIVLAGAFVIVAVFFLTLSYLGWRHRRARSLATGVVAMAVALGVTVLAGFG